MAIRSMRCSFSIVVFVGVSLVCQRVAGQSKPISLAYQITHVDNATPALSPDGKRMIYESVIDGKEQLFSMDLDGSNSIQLTHGPNGHEDPAWSPDGQKVALVSDENEFQVIYCSSDDLHPPKKNPSEIYSVDIETKNIVCLISGGINTFPSWSPDGKQ